MACSPPRDGGPSGAATCEPLPRSSCAGAPEQPRSAAAGPAAPATAQGTGEPPGPAAPRGHADCDGAGRAPPAAAARLRDVLALVAPPPNPSRTAAGCPVAAQTEECPVVTQTDEGIGMSCEQCGQQEVLHGCGHWRCVTLTCRPAWFQALAARNWNVPKTRKRMFDTQLYDTLERCEDCRPEGRCLRGAVDAPRYCNFVFKRGTCRFGSRCAFCHLHGRGEPHHSEAGAGECSAPKAVAADPPRGEAVARLACQCGSPAARSPRRWASLHTPPGVHQPAHCRGPQDGGAPAAVAPRRGPHAPLGPPLPTRWGSLRHPPGLDVPLTPPPPTRCDSLRLPACAGGFLGEAPPPPSPPRAAARGPAPWAATHGTLSV
ncbi:unnamed protein product [Prorocentrum cordatum]|uniref:C3H1-type domain-containing protein n=1 Tax=Prorocentrum cordatum TaxID=2364126 RepID=A0ABN9U4Q9_9DINO|nr:unnamed protein product [Polarella glacialis]